MREIRAHVGEEVDAHGDEPAVLVHRHLGDGEVVASVGVAEEVLAALADPLHRSLEALGRDRRKRIFLVAEELGPEAAADVGRNYPHLVLGDSEHVLGDAVAHAVAALRPHGQRVAVGPGVVFGDDAARLHVVGDDPVVDDLDPRDPCGADEGRVRGALRPSRTGEGDVGVELRPDQRRAVFQGALHVDHGRQRIVVDLDRLRCHLRVIERVGDDERDRIADMADGVEAKQRMPRSLLVGAVDLAKLDLTRQSRNVGHIRAAEDQANPGHGAGGGEIADGDPGVAHGRAEHEGAERALGRVVVGEAAGTGDQRLVLLAADRGAHAVLDRCRIIHGGNSARKAALFSLKRAIGPAEGADTETISDRAGASNANETSEALTYMLRGSPPRRPSSSQPMHSGESIVSAFAA